MTRALLASFLLAATAVSTPARADDRLVQRLYDPAHVVRVPGRANVQATIQFSEDETIENVAIGDSQAWQVTPNKRANLLFVKPLGERATTNMTVVTSKRTYLFDLVASPANRTPLYVLAFTYPKEEVAAVDEAATVPLPDAPTADELAVATDPRAVVDPADLNFAWAPKGAAGLLPQRIYDDGAATYITWRPETALPAILVKDAQGNEGPVNYAVRGDVIVLDAVPREIVLRAGRDSAMLVNTGPVRPARPTQTAQASAPAATEVK